MAAEAFLAEEAGREVVAAVSITEVEEGNAVVGEAGEIGRRHVNSPVSYFHPNLIVMLQNNRTREASVAISSEWQMLEEVEFHRLTKLRLDVDDPEDL